MASFIITDPKGVRHKVTAPDGTSAEDALAYAQKAFTAPKTPDEHYTPTGDFWENLAAGMGRPVDQLLDSGKQIYNKATGNKEAEMALEAEIADKRRLDKPLMDTVGGNVGNVAGDVLMTAVPGAKAAGLAGKVFTKALPRALVMGATAGTVNAAYEGGAKPTTGDESRGENAAYGFGGGVGGQIVGSALGRAIKGIVPTVAGIRDATGKLLPEFEDATLGQVADKTKFAGKIANNTEEASTSLPGIGSSISNARRQGVDTWRGAMLNKVRAPGTPEVTGTTGKRIEQLQGDFHTGYDNALAGNDITPDAGFKARVQALARDPNSGLPPGQRNDIADNVMEQYNDLFRPGSVGPNGPLPPTADATLLKQMESRLGRIARNRGIGTSPDSAAQADVTGQMRDALRGSYRSQLPLSTQQALRELDGQYAPFKTVEKASTYVGNQNGDFTPQQLLLSAKSRTAAPEFAARQGMLQPDADVGKEVFQDRLANSGTPDRTMTALSFLNPMLWAKSTVGAGPVAFGTTKLGRGMATGDTKAQIMLKKMRLDKALEQSGVPAGQILDDSFGLE